MPRTACSFDLMHLWTHKSRIICVHGALLPLSSSEHSLWSPLALHMPEFGICTPAEKWVTSVQQSRFYFKFLKYILSAKVTHVWWKSRMFLGSMRWQCFNSRSPCCHGRDRMSQKSLGQPHHMLSCGWVSHWTFLSFSFLVCKYYWVLKLKHPS